MSAVCVYNKHQQQLEWNGGMLWFSLSLAGPISANLHKTLVKLRRPVGCACFQKRTLLFPSVLRLLLFCISLHHQHQHRHAFERAQGSISPNRLLASRSCLQRGRNQRQTSSLLQFSHWTVEWLLFVIGFVYPNSAIVIAVDHLFQPWLEHSGFLATTWITSNIFSLPNVRWWGQNRLPERVYKKKDTIKKNLVGAPVRETDA